MVTTAWAGAAVAIPICLAASPYAARLTLTVPDRSNATWYRGVPVSRRRQVVTAGIALVLGALAGAAAGLSALLPAFIVLALTGTPLIVIDHEQHRLPNRLLYPMAASAIVLLFAAAASRDDWSDLLRAGEGGAAVFAVLYAIMLVSPRAFGYGDARLGGVMGLYLGFDSWAAVYSGILGGFVLGAGVAVVLLAARRASRKTAIALGPMLVLGTLLVLAFGLTPSMTA
jgi:leader peptidase (prepilin peptidase)/N-methyltransferase